EPLDERGRDVGRRVAQVGAGAPHTLALRLLPAAGARAPPRIEPDGHGAEPEERDRRLAMMEERLLGLAPEPCGPRPARLRLLHVPRHRGAAGGAAPARLADERRPAGGAGDPETQRHTWTLAHPAAPKNEEQQGPGPTAPHDRSRRGEAAR